MLLAMAWTAFILWILYGTSAAYEYGSRVPGLRRLMRVQEYLWFKSQDPQLRYSDYMLTRHPTLLVKLFSCPVCLGAWIACVFAAVFGCVPWIPLVYGGGLLGHLLFSLAVRWLNHG